MFISTSFLNNQIGYILSENNLYKTTDGGSNWILKYTDNNIKNVVYFISENIGFIGTNNKILKTIDGGVSWTTVQTTSNNIKSISFPTQNIGFFMGGSDTSDVVYKTINQGNTFNFYPLLMQSIKEKICFINENVGYIIGWYSPYIKKTIDGGLTWVNLYNSFINGLGGMEINFINEQNGFYVNNSGGQSKLFATTNSGQTWVLELSLNLNNIYGFSKISTKFNNGFLIGVNGIIYKKTNLLSINEVKKNENEILIFPNPTFDEISIMYNPDLVKVESISINDSNGKMIENIKSDFEKISLQKLSKGTYFINIQTEKGKISKKVIRK